jgi:hypothetical protein
MATESSPGNIAATPSARNGIMIKRLLPILGAFFALMPGNLRAQGCSRTATDAAERLPYVVDIFTSPDQASARGSEIQTQDADIPAAVVQTPAICNAVLHRGIEYLRQTNKTWREHREGRYEMALFHVGAYYALTVSPCAPAGSDSAPSGTIVIRGIPTEHWPLLIYRASDLALVKVMY